MVPGRFNGIERRAYARLQKALPVRFRISANPAEETYSAITKNISQGGLCLEVEHNREALLEALSVADQKIGIDINSMIPSEEDAVSDMALWVRGRIDWTRKSDAAGQVLQVGLEFEDLTEEARQRIREFLVNQFMHQYPQHD